jgi:tryptophan synthase alpha subunit
VIVGSALIKRFLEGETVEEVVAWVRSLKDAIG